REIRWRVTKARAQLVVQRLRGSRARERYGACTEVGELHDARERLRFEICGGTMVKRDGFAQSFRQLPGAQQRAAEIGVIEAEALTLEIGERHVARQRVVQHLH